MAHQSLLVDILKKNFLESKPECVSSLHVLEPELINKAVSGHEFDVQDEVLQLINKAVKRLREGRIYFCLIRTSLKA